MEKVEVIRTEPVNHISRINEGIMKSFDNIMYQQNKMDNKAFIFIGFIGVVLGIINKNNISNIPINWILGSSILLLVISLLPIATEFGVKVLKIITSKSARNEHNIFYYTDIFGLCLDDFIQILKNEYKLAYYTPFELKLIEQILINANILKVKVFWHTLSYIVLFGGCTIFALILFICKIIPFGN